MRTTSSWTAGLVLAVAASAATAQQAPGTGAIYRCKDANGKNQRSDRPMTNCVGEQVLLNRDGSINQVIQPPLTDEERADKEAKERAKEIANSERGIALRRDRNLLTRFPDKARHDAARKEALDSANAAIAASEARIADLLHQRKPMLDEAEFYQGKALPPILKSKLDANEATIVAQRIFLQNQRTEVDRINQLFDIELAHLRELWAGKPAR